jgi:hypothetical protein
VFVLHISWSGGGLQPIVRANLNCLSSPCARHPHTQTDAVSFTSYDLPITYQGGLKIASSFEPVSKFGRFSQTRTYLFHPSLGRTRIQSNILTSMESMAIKANAVWTNPFEGNPEIFQKNRCPTRSRPWTQPFPVALNWLRKSLNSKKKTISRERTHQSMGKFMCVKKKGRG